MSPVIATVILVAVTITVSVAVAYWMGGIAGQYTKFEKVEIQSAIVKKEGATGSEYWNVSMKLKNTGTATATMISAFINDEEIDTYNSSTAVDGLVVVSMSNTQTINSGAILTIYFVVDYDNYKSLSSGTTVNIKIHSAGGMDYIKLVELI